MAYGVIIQASAATAEGTHTVEILRDGYSGAVHTVHAGGPVFYTEEYGQRGGDIDAEIRPSQITAHLVVESPAALDLIRGTLTAESRQYRLHVRHGAAVMWQGYVLPVTSVTQLDDVTQAVRVVAKDRARSLDDQAFVMPSGAPHTGQAALSTILERELGHVGHSITQHEYAARFRPAGVSDPYAQVRIDQARFYDDETGEPTHSRGDVVRAILGTQQAQLTQWRGRWEVTTPHAAGDTFSVDRWVARSDELSGEPPARQGRASYDVGGTSVALQNGSFEAGPIGGSPTAPGWTGMARRQVPLSAVEGQYVGVRDTVITEGPITPEQARSMASSYGYQRVPIVVGTGAFTVKVSAGGRIIQSGSGPGIRTDRHTLYLFAHIRHTGGYYYNDEAGQWQSGAHKIYLGSTFTSGLDAFWIGETIEVPTVPEGGEVEIALYSGVLATGDGWQSGWTAETWYDAVELTPASATGREVISFTSYSPTVQDGETEAIELPIGDGPFESARGAMRLASGALTSEWRVATESRTVPHTQILAEHLMRTRGKGRRRVRLTTTGPVSEMAPVKKMQLDSIGYWPVYMSIEWPRGQATIEGIELIEVPVPSGMRETVEVRPAGPSAQAGAHRVYDYVQDQGYVTPEAGDARYLRQTGGTLTGDLVFAGGGRLRGNDDALHVYDEGGTNHGVLTVGVLRVLDHVDSYQTDILEVEDQYIKVNRGQPYPDLNGGLIVERGAVDSYLEFDEGRERWGWRLGTDLNQGTFRAFVDESRTIGTQLGISGGGNLGSDLNLTLTGQAQQLHLATGTGVFKRTSSGSIAVDLIVNADITPNTITNNRLVNPHITLNAGTGIAAIGQIDLGGSSSITLSQRLQGVHGAANGLLVGTSNGAASRTIQGTTNQVNVSNGNGVSGNPTLSLPQDIHTGASVQFASLHTRLSGRVPILLERTGTNAAQWSMGFWGDAFAIQQGDDISASAQLYIQPDSGNFGFGTTNPQYRVDVTGEGRFTDFLTLDKQATSSSHALRADRTLRIQGTSNRISVNSDAALDLTSDRTWQITAPQDLHTDADFLTKTLRTKDWAGSTSFASGWTGHGWRAEDDHLEVTDLTVRNRLRVYELLIEQIRANNGSVAISNAAEVASVSGSTITLDEGVPVPFVVNDILRAQRFTGEGVYVSMIRVTSVGSGSFDFTLLEGDAPAEGMEFVRVGNTTDEDRQGLVYLTASDSGAPFIDILDGIDDHTKWNSSDVVRSRFGRLDGLTVPGFGQLEGYGGYIQRGYIDKEVIIGGAGLSIDSFQQRPSALWHFDGSLVDTISGATPDGYEDATITDYGLVTGAGLVATLRRDGKFGGGVAVEEGTENLVPAGNLAIGYNIGGGVTYDTAYRTITVPTLDAGTYTLSWREFVPDARIRVRDSAGQDIRLYTDERTFTFTLESSSPLYITFRDAYVSDLGTDVYTTTDARLQVEAKPFATSFVEGTRAHGVISYPLSLGDAWSLSFWATSEDAKQQGSADIAPRLFDIYNDGDDFVRVHRSLSGPLAIQVRHNGQTINSPSAAYEEGEHLYTLTYDGETYRLYRGVEEITTLTAPPVIGSAGLWIGRRADTVNSIWNGTFSGVSWWGYALSPAEIRRIALSGAPIQERPSQVRITGEQILVGTDTLIRDGFIQSKYIAANSITTEQLSFTPLLSADGTGDIIATINATSEGLRIAGSKIEINGDVHFTSDLYDPSKKETPSGAQNKANAAADARRGDLAEALGYSSWSDMAAAAAADETIISGGHIRTSLIDTDSLFAEQAFVGDWDIVSGNITSSGVTLNSSGYLDLASNAGISGTGTGDSSVRFWAGNSYSSRSSAAFNVRHDGTLNATKANITGTINATGGVIGSHVIIGQYDPVIAALDSYRVYLGRSVLPLGGSQFASQPGLVVTGNNPNQYATFGLRFIGSNVIPSMRLQRDADNRIILNDASALVRMSSGGNDVLTVDEDGLKVTGEINATTGSIGPNIRMGETVTYAASGIGIGEYGSLATTGHRGFISFGTSANQFVRVGLARPEPAISPRPHIRIQDDANNYIEMASHRQFQYPMFRIVTGGQTIIRSTEVGMVLGGFNVGSSTIRGSGIRGAVQLTSDGRLTAWGTDDNLILDTGSGILRGANTYRVIDQSPNLKTYDSATWTDGFSTHFVPVEGDDYVVFAMRARMANASAVGRTRIIIQLLDGHSGVGDYEGGTVKTFAAGVTDSALMFMTGYLEVAIPEAWRGRLCRVTHQIHRFQGTGQIQIREIVAMVASKICYEQQFSNDWLGFTPEGTPPPVVTRNVTFQKFGLAQASPGTVTVSHSPANNGTTTTSFSGASTTKSFNNNDTITFTAPMHAEDTNTGLMLDFSHWVVDGQTYMGQSITRSITANTTIAMYFQRPGGDFRVE